MTHKEINDSTLEWYESMANKYPIAKKKWYHRFKRSYVVSRYTNYEFINTEEAWCKLFLRIKYHRDGYTAIKDLFYPSRKVSNFLFNVFGWNTYNFNSNITIERHRPNTGQVTYHSPWHDCI